ncbi:MAG: DUF1559 domain-containing protein, partial [Gemmataceae bacterium]
LGLAAHNYESTCNCLPPGSDGNGLSVLTQLLPYIDQEKLFRLLDRTKGPLDKENKKVREVIIKVFVSPLDAPAAKAPDAEPDAEGFFGTNYFGNAGTNYALKDNNGVLFDQSRVQLLAITDGTSNTLMFIEGLQGDGGSKAVSVARQHVRLTTKELAGLKEESGSKEWKDGEKIAGDRGQYWISGKFLHTLQTVTRSLNDKNPDVDCGGKGGLSAPRGLIGGVNVGLCDGSVRFINEKVSFKTWQAAATRQGGEILGGDW